MENVKDIKSLIDLLYSKIDSQNPNGIRFSECILNGFESSLDLTNGELETDTKNELLLVTSELFESIHLNLMKFIHIF